LKSPSELRDCLRRQFEMVDHRVSRILGEAESLPIELAIGLPTPNDLLNRLEKVRQHVQLWRSVRIGEVVWTDRSYRSASETVEVPKAWRIHQVKDWIAACNDDRIFQEYASMTRILSMSLPTFHELLLRRRNLWQARNEEEVIQACQIAASISPGDADGRPLRLLSEFETDTKFFERNRSLLLALLDQRFDDEASRIGLEAFLGAANESEHWLLVHELESGLLPMPQIRVRTSDLGSKPLPGQQILIIENESCHHLLPRIPGTLAILGSGFDIQWTSAEWLRDRKVAYWGDIDTWGMKFLSDVRMFLPSIEVLLMDWETFQTNQHKAVPELARASATAPTNLTQQEAQLYRHLTQSDRGRLEQEFVDPKAIHDAIQGWSS
jgi:hypothetical protein